MLQTVNKCVLIIDTRQEAGAAVNTAACLGFSLGNLLPHELGPAQYDADGLAHGGLLNILLPILAAEASELHGLVAKAYADQTLAVIDMSNVAQRAKTQQAYAADLAKMSTADVRYAGVAIYGPAGTVNKLTGNLRLFGR